MPAPIYGLVQVGLPFRYIRDLQYRMSIRSATTVPRIMAEQDQFCSQKGVLSVTWNKGRFPTPRSMISDTYMHVLKMFSTLVKYNRLLKPVAKDEFIRS